MDNLVKINEMVVTIDGTTKPKQDCRRMGGEFYLKGEINVENSGQCYYINGKYYKYNTGYIVFDHRVGQYIIKNTDKLQEGVVRIEANGNLVMGFFTREENGAIITTLEDPTGNTYVCLNKEILENTHYIENLYTGRYSHRLFTRVEHFLNPGNVSSTLKNTLPYDSRGAMDDLMAYHKNHHKPKISKEVKLYSPILGDLTFGVEYETTKGQIPPTKCKELGLIALKDGSIVGLEYATIPLQGEKGLQTLINGIVELRKYTSYDKDCSLHFHIGNIPRTEEFFLAVWKVLCTLENPMFGLFPLYKKYNFGVKRKHYTKPLPIVETLFQMDKVITKDNIKSNFGILYNYLSMGQPYSSVKNDLNNVMSHPSDPHGNSKWNIRSRYHWVNLIPLLFGNKETIEFRLHTPTYDLDKIVNYLVLCTSIINFAKNNTKAILTQPEILMNLNLGDVVYKISGQMNSVEINRFADYVYAYIGHRRDYNYMESSRGDLIGNEDGFRVKNKIPWAVANTMEVVLSKIPSNRKRDSLSGYANQFNWNVAQIRNAAEDHVRNVEARRGGGIQFFGNGEPQVVPQAVQDIDPFDLIVENDGQEH
jgi:hypothetical protein